MRKSKRKMSYAVKRRLAARRIVGICKMIAKKDVSQDLAELVEDYIVTKLPAASCFVSFMAIGDSQCAKR